MSLSITNSAVHTAERVVITLPLGVLQSKAVTFLPALPSRKQQAIAALGMGVLNKCFLRFPAVFWPEEYDWLEYIPEQHGQWVEWVSFARPIANRFCSALTQPTWDAPSKPGMT